MNQIILPVIALLLFAYQATAQFYQPIMIDPSTLKFFDTNSAFIANMEMVNISDGKPDGMPVKIAVLGNMTRVEMDITKGHGVITNDDVTAEYFADLKTAGSAESVSIFNPDKKYTLTILPRLKVYVQTPIPEKAMDEMNQRPKAEKVELGKDKVDGQLCTKYTIKFDVERPMDVWRTWESPNATVWIAQNAPSCPMRMDVFGADGSTNCTLMFKSIQSGKVDSKLFDPPKGFTKCDTMEALMEVINKHWPKDKN